MPSFVSLAAEYTPRSNRQAVIGLLWTGFPLGGVMGGLLASRLINAVGWPSLFYIGGILPLGLSIVLIRALPDSIEFLVMRGAARRDLGTALKKKRIQPPRAECSQEGCEPPSASARLPTFFKSLSSS